MGLNLPHCWWLLVGVGLLRCIADATSGNSTISRQVRSSRNEYFLYVYMYNGNSISIPNSVFVSDQINSTSPNDYYHRIFGFLHDLTSLIKGVFFRRVVVNEVIIGLFDRYYLIITQLGLYFIMSRLTQEQRFQIVEIYYQNNSSVVQFRLTIYLSG